jgi:ABC-type Fe3+ transport system substrate-binding protein
VFRSTVAAVVTYTANKELAEKFIDFLASDEIKKIYASYGWIHKPA